MARPTFVTLIDKEGGEVIVSSPVEVNALVYGHGYRLKDHDTVEAGVEALADNPTPEVAEPVTQSSKQPAGEKPKRPDADN